MRDTVRLTWRGPVNVGDDFEGLICAPRLSSDPSFYKGGVYAIFDWGGQFSAATLLYIGMAYDQMIPERVGQHDDDHTGTCVRGFIAYTGHSAFAKIAIVEPISGQRKNRELVTDVENLLIYSLKPRCNRNWAKDNYHGRSLTIVNTGRPGPIGHRLDSPD